MKEEILLKDGPDRRGRLCRCSKCGATYRCTPETDFWVTEKSKPFLLCASCFSAEVGVPEAAL